MNCNTQTQTNPNTERVQYVRPFANITETADGFVVEAELPGVNKDGLAITLENNELTIVGRRTSPRPQGQALYRESRAADYKRVFELDSSIDAGRIAASLDNGLLKLQLPKAESVKPRKIDIAG